MSDLTPFAMMLLILTVVSWVLLIVHISTSHRHKHTYVVVHEMWMPDGFVYVRKEYDFCVKCGEMRSPQSTSIVEDDEQKAWDRRQLL